MNQMPLNGQAVPSPVGRWAVNVTRVVADNLKQKVDDKQKQDAKKTPAPVANKNQP